MSLSTWRDWTSVKTASRAIVWFGFVTACRRSLVRMRAWGNAWPEEGAWQERRPMQWAYYYWNVFLCNKCPYKIVILNTKRLFQDFPRGCQRSWVGGRRNSMFDPPMIWIYLFWISVTSFFTTTSYVPESSSVVVYWAGESIWLGQRPFECFQFILICSLRK